MAVTIIKVGFPKSEKPLEATCRECKSVIGFLPTDAKFVPDHRDGNG